jgi:hypothetical protein
MESMSLCCLMSRGQHQGLGMQHWALIQRVLRSVPGQICVQIFLHTSSNLHLYQRLNFLLLNLNDPKSVILALEFPPLIIFLSQCSCPLLPKTLNIGFTVYICDMLLESSQIVVVTASVKEDERGGQGHTSASLLHQSAT